MPSTNPPEPPWRSARKESVQTSLSHYSSGLGTPDSRSPCRRRTQLASSRLARFAAQRTLAVTIAGRAGRRMWRTSSGMLRPLPLPGTRVGEVVFVGVITNDLRLRGPPALRGQEVRLKGPHFSLEKCRFQICYLSLKKPKWLPSSLKVARGCASLGYARVQR